MTNMNLAWLGPILCVFHFLSTPFFFIKRWDNSRFTANYIVYTVVMVALIFGALQFLPDDMGFDGMVFLYPLLIPVVFTAPLAILIRTIFFNSDSRNGAEEDISRRTDSGRFWTPGASARPGAWPPASGAAFPSNIGSALPDDPEARRIQALKELLWIEALSVVVLMAFAYLKSIAATVLSMIFPAFVSDMNVMGRSLLPSHALTITVETVIVNIAVVEIVWQYWTRRVSPPQAILFSRPLKYHILALVPLVLFPLLRYPALSQMDSLTQSANTVQLAPISTAIVPGRAYTASDRNAFLRPPQARSS